MEKNLTKLNEKNLEISKYVNIALQHYSWKIHKNFYDAWCVSPKLKMEYLSQILPIISLVNTNSVFAKYYLYVFHNLLSSGKLKEFYVLLNEIKYNIHILKEIKNLLEEKSKKINFFHNKAVVSIESETIFFKKKKCLYRLVNRYIQQDLTQFENIVMPLKLRKNYFLFVLCKQNYSLKLIELDCYPTVREVPLNKNQINILLNVLFYFKLEIKEEIEKEKKQVYDFINELAKYGGGRLPIWSYDFIKKNFESI